MGVIINTQSSGNKEWTLLNTVSAPASSGNTNTVNVTVPATAKELLIVFCNTGGYIFGSTVLPNTENSGRFNYTRIANNAITDFAAVEFEVGNSQLKYVWTTGTVLRDGVGKLYYR